MTGSGPNGTAAAGDFDLVPLRIEDAPALAGLHQRCMGAGEGWSEAGLWRLLTAEAGRGVQALAHVAGSPDPRPVAFILAFAAADEAEILAFCVAPEHRRLGLGTRLLTRLMGELAAAGTARLYLEVRASNFAARQVYARAGLAEAGRRKGYYPTTDGATREDAVVLARRLLEG